MYIHIFWSVTTNDLYHPSVLPDYGGDLFKHVNAKLRQLDLRDINDDLIPPQEWYSQLRQGTFVMVRATLQAFNWDNRRVSQRIVSSVAHNPNYNKVYQLNAHTIRVLRDSDADVEERKMTVLDPDAFNNNVQLRSEAAAMVSQVQLGKRRAQD